MLQDILDASADRTEQKLIRLAERLNNKREKMLDTLYRKNERGNLSKIVHLVLNNIV